MSPTFSRRRPAWAALLAAAVAVGALATAAVAATSLTLTVAKHATVKSVAGKTTHPNVVVNTKGKVVYTLSGESRAHPECTQSGGCFQFWPPVTVKSVKSLRKAAGVKGKLGIWKRNGFIQVTLDGHPLYTFAPDSRRDVASGEGITSFGGTWHVRLASPSKGKTSAGTSTGSGTGGW